MTKKPMVMRPQYKKDACVICGKRLSAKYAESGIGDRCYKAAKKRYPSLFGEDGKIIRSLVTEDVRLDLMEFMRGAGKENAGTGKENAHKREKVCYCIDEKDEDIIDFIQENEDEGSGCACEDEE